MSQPEYNIILTNASDVADNAAMSRTLVIVVVVSNDNKALSLTTI
jgi:hypothetical protein